MAFAPINPTQITPPRVDFIDERTGAISREWYRFLLSLKDSTQTSQDAATLGPDSTSLTVSYSAMLDTLAQATGSQSTGASVDDVAAVQTQVQDLASQSTGASVDAVAAVQTQVQDLASQPTSASVDAVAAVQTQVQDLALSLQSDIQSYLAPVWSAVQDLSLTPSVIPSVGSMVYPAAGIANSTGTAWGTSYTTTGSGTVVVLATGPTISGTYYTPAISNADLTAVSGQVARSGRLFAARTMAAYREDSGPGYPLAPHLGFRRYVQFQFGAGTTVTTLASTVGNGAYTCVSPVAPTIVTPNVTEPYYRSTISTSGSASNIAYWVGTRPLVMAGNPFTWVFRFDINSAASNVWQYIGLADVSTAPTAANPTTATAPGRLGIAFGGSVLQIINNLTGTGPTVTSLTGASYTSPSGNAFEFIIRSDGTNYYWQIGTAGSAWVSGNGFNQQLNSGTFSANKPAIGANLFPLIWIANNGAGSASTIGPMLFTLETEG
jgi:hypothetical protein